MEYKFSKVDNIYLSTQTTSKYKINLIEVTFTFERDRKRNILDNVLMLMLLRSTKKYPSKKIFDEHLVDLNGSVFYDENNSYGNVRQMIFGLNIIDEKFFKESMLEQGISFLNEIIFNPNVENDEFMKDELELIKKRVREDFLKEKENPKRYSYERTLEVINEKNPYILTTKEVLEILETINTKNLYEYYQSFLKKVSIKVNYIGNKTFLEVKKILKDNFNTKIFSNELMSFERIDYLEERTEIKSFNDYKENDQSILKVVLHSNYEKENKHRLASIFTSVMSSSNGLLFTKVREEKGLAYNVSAHYDTWLNFIAITAGIDYSKKDETVKIIEEILTEYKSGNIDEEIFKNIIENRIINYRSLEDDIYALFNYYSNYEQGNRLLPNELISEYEKFTIEDLTEYANSLTIHTVYILGGNNE